jgi:predicted ATPase/DNA-binding CsgD family transcriptional regulator
MPGDNVHNVGNLPSELSSFVGRRRELREVKRLLGESRLVTLTGVGGTGKTRLALRAAADMRRAFGDGVWFVDLTQLHGPGLLAQQVQDPDVLAYLVAATLGLQELGGAPPLQMLVGQLADRQVLLVLDNCEHLLPASAILAHTLLHGCPELRVLATSREPLSITGEMLFAVPPLPTPDPDQRPSLADMRQCEAVVLFLARAQAAVPAFQLTKANHVAVAQLCHRLDGLPLAIELAAARVPVLAPHQILGRLAERFTLLSRGSRSAPERQQTLRACVDWSFHLCAKPERLLWARLSVFAGGFELDAVEGICADEDLPEADLLGLVAGLVDRSILVRDDHGRRARYRMLEAIRDYGQEQLIEAGEQATLPRRHRDWYQQLAAGFKAEWIGDRQATWLSRLDQEFPNLRAAVEFSLTEPGQAEAALRIVVDLPPLYWWSRGVVREGGGWLDRALAQVTVPTLLRAQGLLQAAYLGQWHRHPDALLRLLDNGQGLAQRLGATADVAYAVSMRGIVALMRGELTDALEYTERGLTILSAVPEPPLALRLRMLLALGAAAVFAGDHDRAGRCYQEILEITGPRGECFFRSIALWARGLNELRRGDLQEAARCELESLRIKHVPGLNDRRGITPLCFEILAWIGAHRQQHERAVTLLGVADTLLAEMGTPLSSYQMLLADHDVCVRQARDALGDAAYGGAFRRGQALTYDDALAYAFEERRRPVPPQPKDGSTLLTGRERQIADLITEGLSNKEIAGSLVISQRTAESHVEHILTKLGFTSRAQVAAWTAEQRGDPGST